MTRQAVKEAQRRQACLDKSAAALSFTHSRPTAPHATRRAVPCNHAGCFQSMVSTSAKAGAGCSHLDIRAKPHDRASLLNSRGDFRDRDRFASRLRVYTKIPPQRILFCAIASTSLVNDAPSRKQAQRRRACSGERRVIQ